MPTVACHTGYFLHIYVENSITLTLVPTAGFRRDIFHIFMWKIYIPLTLVTTVACHTGDFLHIYVKISIALTLFCTVGVTDR